MRRVQRCLFKNVVHDQRSLSVSVDVSVLPSLRNRMTQLQSLIIIFKRGDPNEASHGPPE